MSSASVALARARSIIAGPGRVTSGQAGQPDREVAGPQPTSSTRAPAWLPAATSAAMPRMSEPIKMPVSLS